MIHFAAAPAFAFVDDATIAALKELSEDLTNLISDLVLPSSHRLIPPRSQLILEELPFDAPSQNLLASLLDSPVIIDSLDLSAIRLAVTVRASA